MSAETVQNLFGDTVVIGSDSVVAPAKVASNYDDKKPFRMTDMLFAGDKKKLWIEYRTLLADGYAVDALFPIMWWGVKSVLHTQTGIAGVSPFVASKIQKGLPKLSSENAIDLACSFLEMVVYVRTVPKVSPESAFERWILELQL